MNKLNTLLANSRFYILACSLLASIFIAAYLRVHIPSDQLYYIRAEQIYGFISIALLYAAVLLTPASKLIGKKNWMQKLLFARRGIGVSAAYFALLHAYLVMSQQIGGLSGLALLPVRFKVSFLLGVVALIILSLMAATSFDKVIKIMTFRRWKMLHRFVYVAGLVVIVHVWLIGTHVENNSVKIIGGSLLGILFALESKRAANNVAKRYKLDRAENNLIFLLLLGGLMWALLSMPALTKNYHSEHHDTHSAETTAK